jgi:hypothetical protein
LLVAAPEKYIDRGSVEVFTRGTNGWTQVKELTASDAKHHVFAHDADNGWTESQKLTARAGMPADQFGASVALSDDGGTALVRGQVSVGASVYAFQLELPPTL